MTITVRGKVDQSGYSQTDDGMPVIRYNTVRATEALSMQDSNASLLKHLSVYKDLMQ